MAILLPPLAILARPAPAGVCADYGEPEHLADAADVGVRESSGLAASEARPGVWFTHDDSGGSPELFAFTEDGAAAGVHPVEGAAALDWEAIGAGPCPDRLRDAAGATRCLYIGDVGDNARIREWVSVYVVPEPVAEDEVAYALERWDASWPGGPRDCEALLVHPRTGRVTLVSKESDGTTLVARLPDAPEPEVPVELEPVAELDLSKWGAVTGGDWAPDGDRVVLRTYGRLLVWDTDRCDPDAHWARPPDHVVPIDESGGEAVAFEPEGGDMLTSTEGSPMVLDRTPCEGWQEVDADCGDTGGVADTVEDPAGTAIPPEECGCGCSGAPRSPRAAPLAALAALALAAGRRRAGRGRYPSG